LRVCFDCGAGSPPGEDGAPAKSCCACFRHFFSKPAAASGGVGAGKDKEKVGVSAPGRAASGKAAGDALAAAERRAKAAEARAEAEKRARLAAEAEAARAKNRAECADEGADGLSAGQASRQKALRAELKDLKAVSATLFGRLFGGAEGHAEAVQAVQEELAAIAEARRGGLPLAEQLDSQRRFVDACVKADAAAQTQLDEVLGKRAELEEQIAASRSAREKAAEKRAGAEAHLAELHSRMAKGAGPAAPPEVRPWAITVDDTLLFQGILQHVDPDAIRATCQAVGGETAEQVSARVAALSAKLAAIAGAAGERTQVGPAAAQAADGAAAGCAGDAVPGPAAGEDDDDQSMQLDAEDNEQLDKLVAELDGDTAGGEEAPAARRAELKKRLVRQAAKMVSKRTKKRGA